MTLTLHPRSTDDQELLRLAHEHAGIGLAIVGLDGRWVSANPALARITGYPVERLLTMGFRDITHPDDLGADLELQRRLLDGEIPGYEVEKRYLHADGRVVWVNLCRTLARDPDGTPRYFIAQVQDITARKRSEQLLDTFFDCSPDLLAIADYDGHLVRVNQAWTRVLQRPLDDITGREFLDLVHPEDREVTRELYERMRADGVPARFFNNRWRHRDGSYRWLNWNALPIPELRLIAANVRDVTRHKEEGERLNAQRQELERSRGELENFALVVSQDLCEPMRVINGFLDLLAEDFPESLDATAAAYVRTMEAAAERMHDLIQDLLTYSRIGGLTGRRPGAVDLNTAVAEVRGRHDQELAAAGGSLTVGRLPTVALHPEQAAHLLDALIGNAVKYRRREVPPHVHVHADLDREPALLVVDDNGIGIEPWQRERVFGVFQRLHTREEYPGTGMGLALCRRIVAGYGGRIWVTDSPLGGTSIRLTLPGPAPLPPDERRDPQPAIPR